MLYIVMILVILAAPTSRVNLMCSGPVGACRRLNTLRCERGVELGRR